MSCESFRAVKNVRVYKVQAFEGSRVFVTK